MKYIKARLPKAVWTRRPDSEFDAMEVLTALYDLPDNTNSRILLGMLDAARQNKFLCR